MRGALSAWVLLFQAFAVQAETPDTGGYLFDAWQLEQGLPQMSVDAVVQGPRGYLWLGTEEGLARFDGLRFTVFRWPRPARGRTHQRLAA